jgi:hypothetical protein
MSHLYSDDAPKSRNDAMAAFSEALRVGIEIFGLNTDPAMDILPGRPIVIKV